MVRCKSGRRGHCRRGGIWGGGGVGRCTSGRRCWCRGGARVGVVVFMVFVGVGGDRVVGEVEFPQPAKPLPDRAAARFVVGVVIGVIVGGFIRVGAGAGVGGWGSCRRGCGWGVLRFPVKVVDYRRGGWQRRLGLP